MDRRMRRSNLIDKAMLQFTICVTILMLLATHYFIGSQNTIMQKTHTGY